MKKGAKERAGASEATLSLAEELILLILNDETGEVGSSPEERSLGIALAGAVLMDLALKSRIDTDLQNLMLVDPSPVGDDLLDSVLADIASQAASHPISWWLERVFERAGQIRHKSLLSLIARGILECDEFDLFFLSPNVSRTKRYPAIRGIEADEVRFRILRLLFSDDIPDPRDVLIVSLAAACSLFEGILSGQELATVKERIDLLCRMDTIGRSITASILKAKRPSALPAARPSGDIPQISGLPVAGSAFALSRDLRSFLAKGYRDLGPIFRFRAFNSRFIALVGPNASLFVQKHGRHFLRSHETWEGVNRAFGARQALMGMDGADHVRMRKLHKRAFSQLHIEDRLEEVVGITRRMIVDWPRNKPIAAHNALKRILVEQIVLLTTGVSAIDYIDELIDALNSLLRVHVMQQRPAWVLRFPRHRQALKRLDDLYALVLEHHERGRGEGNPDLIDELLELHRIDPLFLPETDLKIAVLGPFFAGIETAANASAFLLYSVLKHPGLRARVAIEAEEFFGHASSTVDRLHRLHTLDVTRRVVLESLRMYPILPALMRTVSNSFEFAGYRVPAGARVVVGCTVAHHLPELFPEPGRFNIERYTPGRMEHEQPGAFAPFGLGAHRCPGSRFAETQMAITTLTILREVGIVLHPPDYRLKVRHTPTPHPSPSFKFKVPG